MAGFGVFFLEKAGGGCCFHIDFHGNSRTSLELIGRYRWFSRGLSRSVACKRWLLLQVKFKYVSLHCVSCSIEFLKGHEPERTRNHLSVA